MIRKNIFTKLILLLTIVIITFNIRFHQKIAELQSNIKYVLYIRDNHKANHTTYLQDINGNNTKDIRHVQTNYGLTDIEAPGPINQETNITIYLIMPTFNRLTQMPDLTKQCNTFSFVPNLHWIIIEDANTSSCLIRNYLDSCPVKTTLLFSPSPQMPHPPVRGSNQRNRGLEWLRSNLVPGVHRGVVYFADDDNTYDKRLFEEMRTLKRGATWPVGMVGGATWEGCVTAPNNITKITKFWSHFSPNRKFPIDMAAFAVNLDLIFQFPNAQFDYVHVQYQEGTILKGLGFKDAFELEPKANGCSQILVWHTKTVLPKVPIRHHNQPTTFDDIWLR